MKPKSYLQWLVTETPTTWWHDSDELERGVEQGSTGVTTNPLLASRTLRGRPDVWAAARLLPQYEATRGRLGYVCGQINPGRAGDRTTMLAMARRYHD